MQHEARFESSPAPGYGVQIGAATVSRAGKADWVKGQMPPATALDKACRSGSDSLAVKTGKQTVGIYSCDGPKWLGPAWMETPSELAAIHLFAEGNSLVIVATTYAQR